MKKILILFATRVLPGIVVLAAFAAGHATIAPDISALETFRAERAAMAEAAENAPETTSENVTTASEEGNAPDATARAPAATDTANSDAVEKEGEGEGAGVNLPPVYRYFAFEAPFAGNADARGSLFTMEIALSTWQSPLVADLFLARLQELQPTMRSLILSEIADVAASDLREIEARAAFCLRLREILTAYLVEKGGNADIVEVIITSFVIT